MFQQHVLFAVAFAVAIDLVLTVEYARSPVQQDKEGEDDLFLNKINRQPPYLVFKQHVLFAVSLAVAIDLVHTVEYA